MRSTELSRFSAQPLARFRAWAFGIRSRPALRFVGLVGVAAMALGGCAQQPAYQRTTQSKEYFPGSIYGKPSPRVVAYGEPVPRGGGFYMVGKPYSVAGRMFFPTEKPRVTTGLASWYGEAFHGRRTANGEIYDCDAITAAHPTMPLPSYARVTNLDNSRSLVVRVNDRGPFHDNRVLDVSRKTAEILDFHGTGTSRVKVEYIGPAGLDGSDDNKLLATLRIGAPAVFAERDNASNVEVASSSRSSASTVTATAEETKGIDPSTPIVPRREAVAEHRPELTSSKGVAIAAVAPLPPVRPYNVGRHAPSRGPAATQMARVGSR